MHHTTGAAVRDHCITTEDVLMALAQVGNKTYFNLRRMVVAASAADEASEVCHVFTHCVVVLRDHTRRYVITLYSTD